MQTSRDAPMSGEPMTRDQLQNIIWMHAGDLTHWTSGVRARAMRTILDTINDYREQLRAEMPTVVIKVADGGVISETEWQALGERLKTAWREMQAGQGPAARGGAPCAPAAPNPPTAATCATTNYP